jgi:hypothetical protein
MARAAPVGAKVVDSLENTHARDGAYRQAVPPPWKDSRRGLGVTPTESELEGIKESSGGKGLNEPVDGAGGASRCKGCGQP